MECSDYGAERDEATHLVLSKTGEMEQPKEGGVNVGHCEPA